MTVAQCSESSQRSISPAREPPAQSEHDATNETATMSNYGPTENLPIASSSNDGPRDLPDRPSIDNLKHVQTQTSESFFSTTYLPQIPPDLTPSKRTSEENQAVIAQRVQFGEFAQQLRQQQYFEDRKLVLQQRKRVLQKTITLAARLHRVSSWVGDGLVEISEQSDATAFVRVHQHFQNLVDLSYSQWDHELHALDPLGRPNDASSVAAGSSDILSKLSSSAQADLFDLVFYFRSNSRFLVERFKVLSPSQIVSLWNPPRFQGGESQYGPFMHARTRLSHQRIQSFSKSLEDYASSFERSNPLSFLLFNIYGTNQSSMDAENQLRLSTWSGVCAELMLTSEQSYQALIIQLLDRFASLYEWRARDSVEMFLMDLLQRGSFLLDQTPNVNMGRRYAGHDPFKTPDAREFFDTAVTDLFSIFVKFDGGFPTGALQFASAMLSKLPLLKHQMDFRGIFFSRWFIEHFLQLTINFPENENMLLKYHISNAARQKILRQLWFTLHDRVYDVYSERPARPVDPYLRECVGRIVGCVQETETVNPYMNFAAVPSDTRHVTDVSITLSISEIVQVLEALSPQAMHGVGSIDQLLQTTAAFSAVHGQYAHASERFDRLRNDLISIQEPGSSTIDVHPCQEQWLQIDVDSKGRLQMPQNIRTHVDGLQSTDITNLDNAQQGAMRLFTDQISDLAPLNGISYRSDLLKSSSLETLFREMAVYTSAKLDPIGCMYWDKAIDTLHERYPKSILVKDDTAVLRSLFNSSKAAQTRCRECCSKLEVQLSIMEDICMRLRSTINKSLDRFGSLRLKIWYSVDVVLSKHYDDAKNITRALNNMAISHVRNIRSSGASFRSGRPLSSRSSASSTFEQPYEDTMNMMKAPNMHGGPKKLSDKQIELTKSWLAQTHIENFCKGEERIHRFCMEVYTLSKSLVGETLSESPVLWASELFARERSLFDIRSFSVTSAPASTRPSSIMSEAMSSSYRSSRQVMRSADSLRMALLEDRRSNASSRINRDCLPPELASSIGSLSRAHSATTAESISSVFSPLPSNARSLTSASVYSRSASIFNDTGLSRFTETTREKAKFLEKVHQALICLLLSDLGCPVWSLGSETDSMLDLSRSTLAVDKKLKQRMVAEALADQSRIHKVHRSKSGRRLRSKSVTMSLIGSRQNSAFDASNPGCGVENPNDSVDSHLANLSELLKKLSQQVDPMEKMSVAEEFYELSLTTLKSDQSLTTEPVDDQRPVACDTRRSSLDGQASFSKLHKSNRRGRDDPLSELTTSSFTAHEVVQHLKSDLSKLRPKTLFRDLQYISAFVPSEYTDNTSRGKALLQLGLAALAYKDEVCRSMVDVADQMFAQNPERHLHQNMQKITEFWMFAACEGNPVAQRELGLLYLSRPELLPVMSLPLSMPSQIFRNDMLWHERNDQNPNTQALCLALHWMQQASANGDRLAKQKLEERKEGVSLR